MTHRVLSNVGISALVLAGGRASRMNFQDKGLVSFRNKPMIAHIMERLTPQVDEVLISANRNLEQYARYAERILRDETADFPGPMAGICTGLKAMKSNYLLVVPCDGPLLPLDLAERLLQGLLAVNAPVAVVHDGEFKQPTYCLIHRDRLADAQRFLAAGERKLGKWLKQNRAELVDFSDCSGAFANMNYFADLNQ